MIFSDEVYNEIKEVVEELKLSIKNSFDYDGFAVFVRSPSDQEQLISVENPDLTYQVGFEMTGLIVKKGYSWRVAQLWKPPPERASKFELSYPGPWMGIPIIADHNSDEEPKDKCIGVVRISRNWGANPFTDAEQRKSEEIVAGVSSKLYECLYL